MLTVAIALDPQEDGAERAIVTNLDEPKLGVVCIKRDIGWEPLYAIKSNRSGNGGVKIGLPRCFVLNSEAQEALRNLWYMTDQSGEAS